MRCLAPISAAAAELGATELAYARLCTKPSQTHAHLVCHSWLQASPRATQASNSLSPDREYAPTTIANMQDTHATRRGLLCPQLYERGAERPVSSLPDTHSKTGHLLHLIRPRFCLLNTPKLHRFHTGCSPLQKNQPHKHQHVSLCCACRKNGVRSCARPFGCMQCHPVPARAFNRQHGQRNRCALVQQQLLQLPAA